MILKNHTILCLFIFMQNDFIIRPSIEAFNSFRMVHIFILIYCHYIYNFNFSIDQDIQLLKKKPTNLLGKC